MGPIDTNAGLIREFELRSVDEVLVGLYEAAGECPLSFRRSLRPTQQENFERGRANSEHDEVDRDGEGWEVAWVVVLCCHSPQSMD